MLKQSLLALALAGLLYTGVPRASAQDAPSTDQQTAPSAAPEHGHRNFDPAKRTEMLTKKLNLTSDQQAKVKDILTSAQSQMQGLRADTSTSQQDRRAKMMDIHKSSSDQIRAVLDPTQQKKWDEMQSKREEHMKEHRGGQPPAGDPGASTQQ